MRVRRIGLVHPPPAAFPSGGDLYDRMLLQQAALRGFPLQSVPFHGDALPDAGWDLLVWDSLLLDRLKRVAEERVTALLHWLPSLDPALDSGRRAAWQSVEDHALARADAVIATGGTVADAVRARLPRKVVYLCEPGVDKAFSSHRSVVYGSTRSADPRRAHVRLLTVAHVLPAKGHAPLLEILRQLRHLPWHWDVAGDCRVSPETTRVLRDRVAQSGLAERIRFHGAVTHDTVASLMAECDLFVFPSTFESYGMVLAEAVAAGLPVLSNRVGAAGQLIRHGVTGLLATPGDWDGFREHLSSLLTDAALRARFAGNLRDARVRRWTETFADFRAACEHALQ